MAFGAASTLWLILNPRPRAAARRNAGPTGPTPSTRSRRVDRRQGRFRRERRVAIVLEPERVLWRHRAGREVPKPLGVALDPDYARNRWVYLYYSEPDPNRKDRVPLRNRIVRFTDVGSVGTENGQTSKSLELIRAEWRRMRDEGPTEAELNNAKTYLTGSYALQLSSTGRIARTLVAADPEGWEPLIREVTAPTA